MRKALGLVVCVCLSVAAAHAASPTRISGLNHRVLILEDVEGIPHIIAVDEHDLFFAQGWVHARDRLFQMDVSRRLASGTLAELLGPGALESDVQLRTIGLRRAAERSLPVLSEETQAVLETYAAGVNAFVARHDLPPEYAALELSGFDPWTSLDSVTIGKLFAFSLSFDLIDIELTEALLTYVAVGNAVGFDGEALFFEDLFRTAPFDPAATIPDAGGPGASTAVAPLAAERRGVRAPNVSYALRAGAAALDPQALELGRRYLERVRDLPAFRGALELGGGTQGSNEWAVSGELTKSGKPLIASDQHLALNTPATFYQNHLRARRDGVDVIGSSFAGAPFVVLGHNRRIAWGATVNPLDVTDVYQELVVPTPTGLATLHQGMPEPIEILPLVFRYNVLDGVPNNLATAPAGGAVDSTFIPPFALIVPRRNNGPIVTPVDPTVGGPALSVQFTGFSPTREFDTFRTWNRARNLDEFKSGFDTFDFGSQNWAYADVDGNIAYFTSAEVPVREDLQNNTVDGLPPFFIRDGTGGNEWVRDDDRKLGQAIPFEILPFEEMPQIVNPPAGYFVNANNDPTGLTRDNDPLNQFRPGGGIFYLNPGYDLGLRAGRITRLLQEQLAQDKVTLEDMQAIQADVVLSDAEFFVPFIAAAFENANAPAAHPALAVFTLDPRVRAAVGRLADWQANPAAPTGIPEGYDASDIDGVRLAPTPEEIDDSIAATIYSMWRGRLINNTIDAVLDALGGLPRPDSQQAMTALRNLFEKEEPGRGASGLEFFAPSLTGVPATVRRDLVVLQSLTDALDRLASDDFAPAFNNSTDQNDYRWGLLHRIVLDHPLNGPFDVPPACGAFPPPLPGLAGIPVDGGFEVVDASRHSARAEDLDDFMFGSGPTRRFVAEMISGRGDHDDDGDEGRNRGIDAVSSLPGGESGVLGDPRYVNLLESWLTNETHPLRQRLGEILPDTQRRDLLLPQ